MTEETQTTEVVDDQSLVDLFADELPEEIKAGEESESETEEVAETESAETEEKPEGETEETDDDSTPESKDESWHLKAVMDEREKRQAAQKKAEELEKRLKDLEKGDEAKKVSVFEDEEGFTNQLLTKVEQDRLNDKMNMSQALAEREFGKESVAEKLEKFKAMATEDPSLASKVREAPLPYHELVSLVDRHEEAKQLENLDEYKDKLRAELKAELEQEMKAKQEADEEKRESITPSLASKRSKGGNKEPVSEISLEDVLPD